MAVAAQEPTFRASPTVPGLAKLAWNFGIAHLLDYSGEPSGVPGSTERAARSLASRLGMSEQAIRRELEQGKAEQFERTQLYRRVFSLADRQRDRPLPRAVLPRISLKSPKITRQLTTAWFAERVEDRYQRCLSQAVRQRPTADSRGTVTSPTGACAKSSREDRCRGGS